MQILTLTWGYKRTDDLLLTSESCEGTSNHLVEHDNEDATEEEGADTDKGEANVVHGSESDPDLIRQFGLYGSEVALFFLTREGSN